MRSIRSLAISGWVIVVLISALGFAAFNARGAGSPEGAAVTTITEATDAPLVTAASGRVGAFVLAEALTFKLELPERIEPPRLDERMGPDARSRTRVRVGGTTTTTLPPTTTTTAPPTTTTTRAVTTTAAPATTIAATTTTAAPTTTTTVAETTTTTAAATEEETTTTAAASTGSGVEQWRGLVSAYFLPELVDQALSVMRCESLGNPGATNPYSGAAGLFQFMPRTWSWASEGAGFAGASAYDAEANIASAAWLTEDSMRLGNDAWSHWSCKP